MPYALNEVFWVNNILEDIGGLVDPEDLQEVEGGSSHSIGRVGAGRNDELNTDRADYSLPSKKNFVTSHPGMDGGSVGVSGGSTTRWTKPTSVLQLGESFCST